MDFDDAKENIQPLAAGRNASILQAALHAASPQELLEQRRQHEDALKNYHGQDPLEAWYEYVYWIEQSYPSGGKESGLDEVLFKCLTKFEKDERYFQDRRMIKLYIKYIDSHENPPECYQQLYNQGIGTMVADLYICWAYYYDVIGNFRKAEQIFRKGIECRAQPLDELQEAHQHFGFTMSQRVLYDDIALDKFKSMYEEKRAALTSLKSHKKKVGSIRTGAAVKSNEPGRVVINAGSNKENVRRTPANLNVYEDRNNDPNDEFLNDPAPCTSQSVVKTIFDSARKQENIKEPGPWNKANDKKKTKLFEVESQVDLGFDILEDDESTAPIKGKINYGKPFIYLEGFVSKNAPQESWSLPITLETELRPNSYPMYDKCMLYPRSNMEFSPEELRGYYWYKWKDIENHFTRKYDLIWKPDADTGLRMYPNFPRKNVAQNEMPSKRNFCPADINIPGQRRLVFNPKQCYPTEDEELQFEEVFCQQWKSGQRKIKRDGNETVAVAEEMDETVCFSHDAAKRKSFFPPRKSMAPSIFAKAHLKEDPNEVSLPTESFSSQPPPSLDSEKQQANIVMKPGQAFDEETGASKPLFKTPFLPKIVQEEEASKMPFTIFEDTVNETCSTQAFNCFINAQSVSTPVTSTKIKVDTESLQTKSLNFNDFENIPPSCPSPVLSTIAISPQEAESKHKQLSTIMETTEHTTGTGGSNKLITSSPGSETEGNQFRTPENQTELEVKNIQQGIESMEVFKDRGTEALSLFQTLKIDSDEQQLVGSSKLDTSEARKIQDLKPDNCNRKTNNSAHRSVEEDKIEKNISHQMKSFLAGNRVPDKSVNDYKDSSSKLHIKECNTQTPQEDFNQHFLKALTIDDSHNYQQLVGDSRQITASKTDNSYLQQSNSVKLDSRCQSSRSKLDNSSHHHIQVSNSDSSDRGHVHKLHETNPSKLLAHQQLIDTLDFSRKENIAPQAPNIKMFADTTDTTTRLLFMSSEISHLEQKEDTVPILPRIQIQEEKTETLSKFVVPSKRPITNDDFDEGEIMKFFISPEKEAQKSKIPITSLTPPSIRGPLNMSSFTTSAFMGFKDSPVTKMKCNYAPSELLSKHSSINSSRVQETNPLDGTDFKNENNLQTSSKTLDKSIKVAKDDSICPIFPNPITENPFSSQSQIQNQTSDDRNSYFHPEIPKEFEFSPTRNTVVSPTEDTQATGSQKPKANINAENQNREDIVDRSISQRVQHQVASEMSQQSVIDEEMVGVSNTMPSAPEHSLAKNNCTMKLSGIPISQRNSKYSLNSTQTGACGNSLLTPMKIDPMEQSSKVEDGFGPNYSRNLNPNKTLTFLQTPRNTSTAIPCPQTSSQPSVRQTHPFLSANNALTAIEGTPSKNRNTFAEPRPPKLEQYAPERKTLFDLHKTQDDFPDIRAEFFAPNLSTIKNSTWLPSHYQQKQQLQQTQIMEQSLHIKSEPDTLTTFRHDKSQVDNTLPPPLEDGVTSMAEISKYRTEHSSHGHCIEISDNEEAIAADERSIYYKNTPKMSPESDRAWSPEPEDQSPSSNWFIPPNQVDIDHSQRIVDEICHHDNVNPFSRDLRDAFLLGQIDFINYIQKLPNCEMVNKVRQMRKNSTIQIRGTVFNITKLIGQGSFGAVYCGKDHATGDLFALKQERPTNLWEYYICLELQSRLNSQDILRVFMSIECALIGNNAGILVSEYSRYGSLIAVCNKIKKVTFKDLDEYVVMHLASQLLLIMDHLHACNIIHADIKADNFLLMEKLTINKTAPTIQLIDFGNAIDMDLFEKGQKFTYSFETECFRCPEMHENRPWTFQLDLYGLAGVIHVLLFGKYMNIVKRGGVWRHTSNYPRYFNKSVWQNIFHALLNIHNCQTLPNLQNLRALLEEELTENQCALKQVLDFNRALESC